MTKNPVEADSNRKSSKRRKLGFLVIGLVAASMLLVPVYLSIRNRGDSSSRTRSEILGRIEAINRECQIAGRMDFDTLDRVGKLSESYLETFTDSETDQAALYDVFGDSIDLFVIANRPIPFLADQESAILVTARFFHPFNTYLVNQDVSPIVELSASIDGVAVRDMTPVKHPQMGNRPANQFEAGFGPIGPGRHTMSVWGRVTLREDKPGEAPLVHEWQLKKRQVAFDVIDEDIADHVEIDLSEDELDEMRSDLRADVSILKKRPDDTTESLAVRIKFPLARLPIGGRVILELGDGRWKHEFSFLNPGKEGWVRRIVSFPVELMPPSGESLDLTIRLLPDRKQAYSQCFHRIRGLNAEWNRIGVKRMNNIDSSSDLVGPNRVSR